MSLYSAIPKASDAAVQVATSAALKTVLQVATPSTTDIRIAGWGISVDGIVVTNPAGVVELIDVSVAATVTSLTPEKWGNDDAPASLCVGGVSATGHDATAEGSVSGSRLLDAQQVHPQGGYSIWYPSLERPKVKLSRFLRIRTLFSVTINCLPWIVWDESA